MRFISNSVESFRKSILEKGYVKVFTLSILLLIAGIIIMTVTSFIITFGEFDTYEDQYRVLYTLSALSRLFMQIGMVLFSLSTFVGAVSDRGLSGDVKRGMVIASSIAILALVLVMIFPGFIGIGVI